MKKLLLLFGVFLFLGTGCVFSGYSFEEFEEDAPIGYKAIQINDDLAMYIKLNIDHRFGSPDISFEDDLKIFVGRIKDVEQSCIEGLGDRYLNSSLLGETTEKLELLRDHGWSIDLEEELTDLDATSSCGFVWDGVDSRPLNFKGYNGTVSYGCRSTDSCITPDSGWVNIILVSTTKDEVITMEHNLSFGYLAESTPPFSGLASDEYRTAESMFSRELEKGASSLFSGERECSDHKPGDTYWYNELCDNMDQINAMIESMTGIR